MAIEHTPFVLDAIKGMLAARNESPSMDPSIWIDDLLRVKRGHFRDEPPCPTDLLVDEFLAQERLFFNQLEDLPTVEKQLQILNLLVREKLTAIFTPLHEFMNVQLRFLLDIERNLLRPPKYQRWSLAFREWSRHDLYGELIGNETRSKAMLRVRLGSAEGPGSKCSPQVDAIAACFKLVSLPALSMLGHLEFLEGLEHHITGVDDIRRADITESRNIFLQAHKDISRVVQQEDLSEVVSHLKQNAISRVGQMFNQLGELLMYDSAVRVLNIQTPPQLPRSRCRMYTFEKMLIFAEDVPQSRLSRAQLSPVPATLRFKCIVKLSKTEAIVPMSSKHHFSLDHI
ncbi:hypothetical protein B0T25DRAFT_565545 [Lasiosphaeria hispida]|uniref:DH domain-containing protein n=1 Tax=Lasiosphaeria hispida TaxID=260671 RepID=A0AAJ0HT15_9PEZI|nr:hypothetical protein B0T25DRAFT_565545 [Lasiosphaeria hispida]